MKENMSDVIKKVQTTLSRRSPEILMGIGIAGMVTTSVLAVRATPKALVLLDEKKRELDVVELTVPEKIQTTWKCYIPAAVTGTASIACLIGARSVNARRNAALAVAYNLSKTAYSEYKEEVVGTVGEKKEQVIKDKVAKKKLEKNPVTNNEVVITDKGNMLCYDGVFGRYFKSDRDAIIRATNVISRNIIRDGYSSLNDFYDELKLEPVDIGYDLGWGIDDAPLDIHFSSQLTPDGQPCLVITYSVSPTYDYDKFR